MKRTNLARAGLVVVVLAALGLVSGLFAANVVLGHEGERYTAHATLAMLPAPEVPAEQVSAFWEVLARGQATRSAAIVLEDGLWLKAAAAAAGVPEAALDLSAGVILDTTLIEVRMTAPTAKSAETALGSVLADAVGLAATISGPYTLRSVVSAEGSAQAIGPAPIQVRGGLGLAGLLVGAGIGLLLVRLRRRREFSASARSDGGTGGGTPAAVEDRSGLGDPQSSSVEISSQ